VPADEPTGAQLSGQSAVSDRFKTTLWTTVLAAGNKSSSDSEAALARLCQTYWRPVYAYIRKRTPSPDQAQDLTQGFFNHLLEKEHLARADPNRGRFRSFLMTSVQNFLRDMHDYSTSQKRGGGRALLSLDLTFADEENEPAAALTPELAFEKRWARSMLDQVMSRLTEEYRASGRAALFHSLQPHLWGDSDSVPYDELARRFGATSVQLRVTAHRVRQRYREILREEIAQTVSSPDEVESEIQYLLRLVSS
jgi:RNA polymerase sigma factor (sigma-70 family)